MKNKLRVAWEPDLFLDTNHFNSLRVAVLYDDLAAAHRAMQVLSTTAHELTDCLELQLQRWMFESLEDAVVFNSSYLYALQADMIIIAASSPEDFNFTAQAWIELVLGKRVGDTAAVVALFGPEHEVAPLTSMRLSSLATLVRRAGLDFFAPEPAQRREPADLRIFCQGTDGCEQEEGSCPECVVSI